MFGIAYLKAPPTTYVLHYQRGRVKREGAGLSFLYYRPTSTVVLVPAVSPKWAAGVLGRPIDELEHSREIDPVALYRSYNRRQLAADFRLMSGAPGPRRTAEGYLMVHLLEST